MKYKCIFRTHHYGMFYVHFLTCCIPMTRCGPRNIFVFINLGFTWMVVIFVARPRDTGCVSKPGELKRRKYSSLFSTQLYPINVANLPNCCNITLSVMVAMQSDVRNSRRHVGTDCLQRVKILELLRPFVLMLRHGYCLVKNIKSMRNLLMVRNKKWNSRSFILRAKLNVTKE
jgi:hypothetical protein